MLHWAPSRFETGDGYFRFDHAKCVVSDHEVKIGTANFDCPAAVLACSITSVKLPAMIILDTNVVSELLRPSPSEPSNLLDSQPTAGKPLHHQYHAGGDALQSDGRYQSLRRLAN